MKFENVREEISQTAMCLPAAFYKKVSNIKMICNVSLLCSMTYFFIFNIITDFEVSK